MGNDKRMNQSKIVIVGAGASGIACALKLMEYGFQNVLLLEAETRIGGRIHTIPFADNVVDMGAQWCHGEEGNVVYEIANRHKLLESTGDVYDKYQCIRSNRELIPDDIAQRLKNIVFNSLVSRQQELQESNESLGNYLHHKYYGTLSLPENNDIDATIAREFFENYKKFENSVEASDDLNEVSGRGYLEYWECAGDLLLNWKDKGYVEFLRLMLKSRNAKTELGLLEGRVVFEKRVAKILWQHNETAVKIICTDGEAIEADHVILTVSLGVLKEQHMQLFHPNLPHYKQRAIGGLAFGTVNKIFLEFPIAFWPENWTGFTLLWRQEDLIELRKTSRFWLEDVFGFYRVSYQPRILCAWIVGPNGRHMETLPEHEIFSGCMYLLRRFLTWSILDPKNFKYSNWYSQENFRGSYSFRSMITEEIGTSARELAKPLTTTTLKTSQESNFDRPIIQFAGEATSDHYYSTVHGAVEAGWREAKRLADFYDSAPKNSHL